MDSDEIPADLRTAFTAMIRQVESAHANWIIVLAQHRPELADELWELHNRRCDKYERLEAMLLLLGTNPPLPALKLYAVFEALDPAATESNPETVSKSIAELNPHQKAALTKRTRTRKALLDAATTLIAEGSITRLMEESAERAGVGVATVYKHFATKGDLICAVYTRLLEPLLNHL